MERTERQTIAFDELRHRNLYRIVPGTGHRPPDQLDTPFYRHFSADQATVKYAYS